MLTATEPFTAPPTARRMLRAGWYQHAASDATVNYSVLSTHVAAGKVATTNSRIVSQ